MKYFALFLFVLSTLSATAKDHSITWRPWQQGPEIDFRFRIGDRYLGYGEWEHYLAFEQRPESVKAIKLSMIHLGNEDAREEVVIHPGSRYGIVKVTNGTMTAHKGQWSWTAQEVTLSSPLFSVRSKLTGL
jgi:hypothetical protein